MFKCKVQRKPQLMSLKDSETFDLWKFGIWTFKLEVTKLERIEFKVQT